MAWLLVVLLSLFWHPAVGFVVSDTFVAKVRATGVQCCSDVSRGLPFAFNHIPKTGGTSIEKWIKRNRLVPMKLNKTNCINPISHRRESDMHCFNRENARYHGQRPNANVPIVCALRDPVSRFLSNYHFLVPALQHYRRRARILPNVTGYWRRLMTPNEKKRYENQSCDIEDLTNFYWNQYKKGLVGNHERPQSTYFCDQYLCTSDLESNWKAILRLTNVTLPKIVPLSHNNWGAVKFCGLHDIPIAVQLDIRATYQEDIHLLSQQRCQWSSS